MLDKKVLTDIVQSVIAVDTSPTKVEGHASIWVSLTLPEKRTIRLGMQEVGLGAKEGCLAGSFRVVKKAYCCDRVECNSSEHTSVEEGPVRMDGSCGVSRRVDIGVRVEGTETSEEVSDESNEMHNNDMIRLGEDLAGKESI